MPLAASQRWYIQNRLLHGELIIIGVDIARLNVNFLQWTRADSGKKTATSLSTFEAPRAVGSGGAYGIYKIRFPSFVLVFSRQHFKINSMKPRNYLKPNFILSLLRLGKAQLFKWLRFIDQYLHQAHIWWNPLNIILILIATVLTYGENHWTSSPPAPRKTNETWHRAPETGGLPSLLKW